MSVDALNPYDPDGVEPPPPAFPSAQFPVGQSVPITPSTPLPQALALPPMPDAPPPEPPPLQTAAAGPQLQPVVLQPGQLPPLGVTNATYNPEAGAPGGAFTLRAPQGPGFNSGMGDVRRVNEAEAKARAQIADETHEAVDAEKSAVNADADLQRQKNQELYDVQRDAQEKQTALDAEHAQNQAVIQGYVRKSTDDLTVAKQKAASTTFDPDHFMKSLDGGDSALMALSVVLGGLGAALTGGPNGAMQVLQSRMDRDVAGQKQAYERARQGVDDANNAYAQFRQQGMDENQAYSAAKAVQTEKLRTAVTVVGAKFADPEAEVTRQKILAGIDSAAAEHDRRFNEDTINSAHRALGERQQARQMEEAHAARDAALAEKQNKPAQRYNEDQLKRYVPGVGLASDQDSAKLLRAAHQANNDIVTSTQTIIDIKKDHPGPILQTIEPKLYAQVKNAERRIMNGIRVSTGQGTLQEAEYERNLKAVGDATNSDWTSGTLENMSEMQRSANADFNNWKSSYLDDTIEQPGAAPKIIEKGDYGKAK